MTKNLNPQALCVIGYCRGLNEKKIENWAVWLSNIQKSLNISIVIERYFLLVKKMMICDSIIFYHSIKWFRPKSEINAQKEKKRL